MKKFTLILLLSFIIHQVIKSQEYVPFPMESAQWNVYLISGCQEAPPDTFLLEYSIHGDTIINDIPYKKLCLGEESLFTIGGLREENKKVYFTGLDFLGFPHDEELLLYDFTVQIGDTIKHNSQGWFYTVILDIDSVKIDGTFHKRYKVDSHTSNHNQDYIIEGIGSVNNGLLGHITSIPTCGYHYWEQVCLRLNDEVLYLNPSFDNCNPVNIVDAINQTDLASGLKVYPNPFVNELVVENNTGQIDFMLKIIDMNGRVVLEKEIHSGATKLELKGLAGLFNVIFLDDVGQIVKLEKIIKN